MSKKNVVLSVLLLTTFAAFVAAITALLLGHPNVFWVIRDVGVLAAIGAAYIALDLFHREAEDLREERDDLHLFNHLLQQELERLREVEVNAEFNAEALKEVSRDAREAWQEVERLEGELVMANNWLTQALFRANDETRRADTYKALHAAAKGRASSNFRLPAIPSDLTEEELNWRRRRAAEKFEATLAAYDYEPAAKPATKKAAAKPADKRGHRCGRSNPSPREMFHYLNR